MVNTLSCRTSKNSFIAVSKVMKLHHHVGQAEFCYTFVNVLHLDTQDLNMVDAESSELQCDCTQSCYGTSNNRIYDSHRYFTNKSTSINDDIYIHMIS